MGCNPIQFLERLTIHEFQKFYGTEAMCEDALGQMRWPHGFRCPRRISAAHGLVYGRMPRVFSDGNKAINRQCQ
jgi:hypothetical protein